MWGTDGLQNGVMDRGCVYWAWSMASGRGAQHTHTGYTMEWLRQGLDFGRGCLFSCQFLMASLGGGAALRRIHEQQR